MIFALAQINPTVGDFNGNVKLILDAANQARQKGARLCMFPEQCIPGYPAYDLIERSRFIDGNLEALDAVVRDAPSDIALLVGFAERNPQDWGKGVFNSVAFIYKGKLQSVHRKTLLPTYDVFDERRYFDNSPDVQVAVFEGMKLGVTICEDLWNDPEFWRRRMYDRDPAEDLVSQGAQLILNISASPFTHEKRHLRRNMLQAAAKDYNIPVLFCNSVGGNDDLVFDGSSLAFGADGELWAQGREFAEDLVLVDVKNGSGDIHESGASDDEAILAALTLGTRDYAHKCGFKKAILGLSGGIDSAFVAAIGVRALGAENVDGILMPSRFSSQSSLDDAQNLADNLGMKTKVIPIEPVFVRFLEILKPVFGDLPFDTTEENLQARIRGNILMAISNKFGHLVLSTGNKSELATGYCTLYGDMVGGLALLSDVTKTTIYRLAQLVNREREIIPQSTMQKPPTAELRPDQTDQDSLPSYDLLDAIIERHIVGGLDGVALRAEGFPAEIIESVLEKVRRNEYKRRQAPPGLKISPKAFGGGRRIPLAQRWKP